MNCAACHHPLIVLELEGVEIDYCLDCSGLWLDQGELELLIQDTSERNAFLGSFKNNPASKEVPRRCPICEKKMSKVLCGESQKIQIDECSKGHGIWCDGGELEHMLRSAEAGHPKVLQLFQKMFQQKTGGVS